METKRRMNTTSEIEGRRYGSFEARREMELEVSGKALVGLRAT
jgi:hypothetical protein